MTVLFCVRNRISVSELVKEKDGKRLMDIHSEAFVEVISGRGIDVKMQYPMLGMKCVETRCLMREEVYERLLRAQESLPEGYFIRIWDAWRPFRLQEELYYVYRERIIAQFGLQELAEEEQNKVISDFVALPNPQPEGVPTHTTGGALDVTLIDVHGREWNMGTEFDSFSPRAYADYFEQNGEEDNPEHEEICKNRRLLREAMEGAGFTGISSEWWHFDYGDRLWAAHTGLAVKYEGVFEQ